MRFLLVAPKYVENVWDHYDFPLGLAYVSASLKKEGFEVTCLNLNHHSGNLSQLLRDTIIENHIDVFCTGGLSVHYFKIKQLFDIVKGISEKIITIAGGGLISSEPELMLQNMKADIGVIGEGEQTIIELADAIQHGKKVDQIKGIIYRDSSGKIVKTDKRSPIKNLDSIPYPDYEGFEIEKYLDMQLPNNKHFFYPFDRPRLIPVVSSRSCPFNCTFCYHPLGKQYRQRSLDRFFGEIEYLVKQYNINSLVILDELFSINPVRAKEFSEKMESYKLKWVAQFRVDQVNIDILERFKKSGLFYIRYGLESDSDIILKSMNKKTCIRDIEKALLITREMKIGIQGNFLFGDPRETLETANETLEWWKKHHFYNINLSQVIPFPGSKIYYYCLEKKIIKSRIEYIEQGCPAINMTSLDQKEFSSIYDKIGDYFSAYRNFGDIRSIRQTAYDKKKDRYFYTLTARCPHCNEINTYKNFHVNNIDIFKIGCKKCNQRYDLYSSAFKHISRRLRFIKRKLIDLNNRNAAFSFMPCLHVNHFIELMSMIGLEWSKLNIKYFIDLPSSKSVARYVDKEKFVDKYMGKYEILMRSDRIIKKKCHDHIFVILPSIQKKFSLNFLKDSVGIPEERIIEIS